MATKDLDADSSSVFSQETEAERLTREFREEEYGEAPAVEEVGLGGKALHP